MPHLQLPNCVLSACLAVGIALAGNTPVLAQTNFVVDPGGAGDFTNLPEAIAQVPTGSLLLVMPGQYAPFVLTKSMTLMGPAAGPKPLVTGLATVSGATEANFQHLDFVALQATDVPGELVIDDCGFGPKGCIPIQGIVTGAPNAISVLRCADVEISRSYASNAVGKYGTQHAALRSVDSAVRIYDSRFLGWSWSDIWSCPLPFSSAWEYEDAGHGIYAASSNVEVTACEVRGGRGTTACVPFGCITGSSGYGIYLVTSTLRLAVLMPGKLLGGNNKPAINATLGSSAWAAGGNFATGQLLTDPTSLIEVRPATAIVTVLGSGGSGGLRRPLVWAPVGAAGFLIMGLGQPGSFLPGWDGLLGINPNQLLAIWPVIGQGLDDSESFLLQLPANPALLGFSVRLQALFPGIPGVIDTSVPALTNSVRILIDF